jgi:lambda family phage minor tail protein L
MSPQGGIDSFLMAEKNLLATGAQWVWLYEIEVPTDPATRYRFVGTPEQVTFRGNVYYPFPITHTVMRATESGDLPSLTVTVSNVSREIIATLEAHQGLIGQSARIILTNMEALTTGKPIIEQDFRVMTMTATEEACAAQLGDISLYETFFPGQRMMRNFCRHQYRSAACGYSVPTSHANYLSTCDKSLDGPNGCQVHGASETAAGTAVIHPNRFGGFPGIPTPTTQGSI